MTENSHRKVCETKAVLKKLLTLIRGSGNNYSVPITKNSRDKISQ